MKKFIIAGLLSLILAPLTLFATPLNTLTHYNLGAGVCGYPPELQTNFCGCFVTEAIPRCKANGSRHGVVPRMCNKSNIINGVKNAVNVAKYCKDYHDMMPDVGGEECAADLNYVKTHC